MTIAHPEKTCLDSAVEDLRLVSAEETGASSSSVKDDAG